MMRVTMRKLVRRFSYPMPGFEIIMWIAIALCVIAGVSNTWHFKNAWDVMAEEREQLEFRIDVLQNYVSEDGGKD